MTEMKPGRELDAAVWLVLNGRSSDILSCRYVDGDVQPHAGYPVGHISPPHYSTDWGAAGLVMEKLAAENYRVWLRHQEDKWIFDIEPHEPGRGFPDYRIIERTSDSGPHAISLVALAAIKNPDA